MSDESPLDAPGRDVSRRSVVKLLGAAPLAGVFGWSVADVEQVAHRLQALAADPAVRRAYAPAFFTEAEWRTVPLLADYVIPKDDRSGSATDAGAPEWMDFMMANENTSEASRKSLREGLAWFEAEHQRRFGRGFADATDAQRRQVLDDIAWPRRARAEMADGVIFFTRFRNMTAAAFFSSQMGWTDLEYIGHQFVPEWQGCPEPALAKLGVSYDLMNTRIPTEHDR